jgi:hypothetical protein
MLFFVLSFVFALKTQPVLSFSEEKSNKNFMAQLLITISDYYYKKRIKCCTLAYSLI